jgi:hypothetical protein
MGRGAWIKRLRIAIPVSAAWLVAAIYAGATNATPFDLIAVTALITSPAVGWTWHWVLEKPSGA